MKILLINPKYSYLSEDPDLNQIFSKIRKRMITKLPSLALLAVAALTPPDIEVEYLDENCEMLDFNKEYDLIGITMLTPQATRAYEIASEYKKRNVAVVLGGTHATSMPVEAKNFADAVVIGEAEGVWAQLLKDFKDGQLKEFYHGKWLEMSQVPIPRFDLLKGFFEENDSFLMVPLEISRGCPIDCSFCSVTSQSGAKMRLKKPAQVIKEIETVLQMNHQSKLCFKFNDPNPFVNRKAVSQVMEAMVPLNLKWNSYADISVAQHPKLLKTMKRSGCKVVAIGLESLVSDTMREYSLWKSKYVKDYRESIKIINDHGIITVANFILGDQRDLKPVLDQILDFIRSMNMLCDFTILTPFPGTRLYEDMKQKQKLKNNFKWGDYNNLNVVFNTEWPEKMIYQGMKYLHQEVWDSPLYQKIQQHILSVGAQN